MKIWNYFRRMSGVWYMRPSHVYLFNWRAWVSIIPISTILAAIVIPIRALLDLANRLSGALEELLDSPSPRLNRIAAWACERREQEWDEVRKRLTGRAATKEPK